MEAQSRTLQVVFWGLIAILIVGRIAFYDEIKLGAAHYAAPAPSATTTLSLAR